MTNISPNSTGLEEAPSDDLWDILSTYKRIILSLKSDAEDILNRSVRLAAQLRSLPDATEMQPLVERAGALANRLAIFSKRINADFRMLSPEESEVMILDFIKEHPGMNLESTLDAFNPSEDIKARIRSKVKELGLNAR